MGIIPEGVLKRTEEELSFLKKTVGIVFFDDPAGECRYCAQTSELLDETAARAGGKIHMSKFSVGGGDGKASAYGVAAAPAIILLDGRGTDTGIRFYGIPAGHEFSSFVEALKLVSSGESGLQEKTSDALKSLNAGRDIKVFVTLSCPYCPAAVRLAHKFAFESGGKIIASMIDAAEFPRLASEHSVMSVPKLVIDGDEYMEGAPTEDALLEKIISGRHR